MCQKPHVVRAADTQFQKKKDSKEQKNLCKGKRQDKKESGDKLQLRQYSCNTKFK